MQMDGVRLELPTLKISQLDEMISIITPTMWKYENFLHNIVETLNEPAVDEFIIINNNVSETPESEILSHPKIRLYNFFENTFVNPAWNFGVSVAKNNILAFLSDDVEFDSKIFPKTLEFIQSTRNIGLIGVLTRYHHEHAKIYENHLTDGSIDFSSTFISTTFGALFFMTKESWKPLPDDLKIMHGECLQYNRCHHLRKNNYLAINCRSVSPWHVTLDTIPREIVLNDHKVYQYINENTNWTHI